jgi:uncharacterized membrane protein YfcA
LTAITVALLGGGVLAGAATQRITGLGFALVSSPVLVLVTGPYEGVLLANLLSLVVNLVVLSITWRAVELRRTLLLTVPALVALPLGVLVAQRTRPAVLLVVVGLLVVVALLALLAAGSARLLSGTRGALTAGALSGFMNATAGVGGPALTLYAIADGWAHEGFVASVQLYFALQNAGDLALKGLPHLPRGELAVALGALGVGIVAGQVASRRVDPARARTAVVVLALAGSAATVAKGVLTW